jgi:hypothetical protein
MSHSLRSFKLAIPAFMSLMLLLTFNLRAELAIDLVSPDNNSFHPPCVSLTIKADVTTNGAEIKDVAFYRNSGTVIRRLRTGPWEFTWENIKPGFYPLYAKIRGEDGSEAYSDTVYVVVGDVQKGDIIMNGGFDCDAKISPWRTSLHETASVTFNIYDDFYFDDATYLACEIDNGSDVDWHIQFLQNTGLDSGHVYQIYFYADAEEPKTIAINWQENGDDWTVHWQQGDILIEKADFYGPFEFVCNVTDRTADFKFILGGNDIDVWLDSVAIIDLNATDVQEKDDRIVVSDFKLYPAFPNPFNMHTVIRYELPKTSEVQLDVYNMQGKKVRTLFSGAQTQGLHSLYWNGTDDLGHDVASGVYVYRMSADIDGVLQHQSHKILLLK